MRIIFYSTYDLNCSNWKLSWWLNYCLIIMKWLEGTHLLHLLWRMSAFSSALHLKATSPPLHNGMKFLKRISRRHSKISLPAFCRVSLMNRLRDWLRASGMFLTGERSYSVEDMETRSACIKRQCHNHRDHIYKIESLLFITTDIHGMWLFGLILASIHSTILYSIISLRMESLPV
jgi:hypothetical protein